MDRETQRPLDMAAIRGRLAKSRGKQYWRTLGELAESPEFMQVLADEVPQSTRTMHLNMDRRQFLTLTGASLALAGLSGCRYLPQQKLVPYVKQPEELTLGIPLYYATAFPGPYGRGLGAIVTSREGRPIKLEGNPGHPDSKGATDVWLQAAILSLYDPDRSQVVMHQGEFSSWQEFFDSARPVLDKIHAARGAGLRILTETVTSPTLGAQLQTIKDTFPEAQWVQYEPVNRDNALAASNTAFGRPVETIYHLDAAKRIVSLDADFLLASPGHVRYAHDFAFGRKIRSGTADMNRLYMVESTPTITGAMADHKLPVRASQVEGIARAIAAGIGIGAGSAIQDPAAQKLVKGIVSDLLSSSGASVVIPGETQPAAVHALAHAINEKIGAVGKTVVYTEPVEIAPQDQVAALKTLVDDMKASRVDLLLILGGNPVYTAPVDIDFASALNEVPFNVHLSQFEDETSLACRWHLAESHFLEAWGDVRAYDGTASMIQPLIQPLYDSRSAHEVLSALFDEAYTPPPGVSSVPRVHEPRNGYTIVRQYWADHGYPIKKIDTAFNRLLHDGVVPDTAAKPVQVSVNQSAVIGLAAGVEAKVGGNNLEVMLRPDPTIWDGRYANNAWLQELPKPINRVTWDNVAIISIATAERLNIPINEPGVDHAWASPVMEIKIGDQRITAPVWMQPGHPDDAVTLTLGYGRTEAGQIGSNIGSNAYKLVRSDARWGGVAMATITEAKYDVASTQYHHLMEGRDLVRAGSLAQFKRRPSLAPEDDEQGDKPANDMGEGKDNPNIYPAEEHRWPQDPKDSFGAYNWGMSIDLQSCIGCNACLVACQAENNIPIVGKQQVMVGHHMNWIRIDAYYKSDPKKPDTYLRNPETYFQPLTCMQCEQAPCEPVCPVAATTHSEEGINQMVYNRCIGTRYCSNNCPYKVRRYNFLNYSNHFDIGVKKLVYNPEVTVRSRGVMEKCSYCVQRINTARQSAKIEGRQLHDGEIVTACQQACPTEAIVFGNITDSATKVAALKNQPHNYGLLTELNTRPRTTYLARVTNPNRDIEPETEQQGG